MRFYTSHFLVFENSSCLRVRRIITKLQGVSSPTMRAHDVGTSVLSKIIQEDDDDDDYDKRQTGDFLPTILFSKKAEIFTSVTKDW